MATKVAAVFKSLAVQLQVDESDFITLNLEGIVNSADFFFRLPTPEKLEGFLEDVVYPVIGVISDGGDRETIPRPGAADPGNRRSWLRGGPCAALRRLWEASKTAAKKELEALTADRIEGEAPKKLTAPVIADMVQKAEERGMPRLTDYEKPGAKCLARVADVYRMGGTLAYVEWEGYTSHDEESRAARLGLNKKDVGFRVVPVDGGLRGVPITEDLRRQKVDEIVAVDDVLRLRAAVFEILDIVSMATSMDLREEFLRALKRPAPQHMRPPTINEVRLVDRQIHETVLGYVARDEGTLADGLRWYLNEGRNQPVWSFLDPQPEDLPDRGLERHPGGGKGKRKVGDETQAVPTCFICGKTRAEHQNRKFCKQTKTTQQQQQQQQRQQQQQQGSQKGRGKGAGKDRASPPVPAHMVGKAERTPPTPGAPQGIPFCWRRHNPDGPGCSGSCKRSHKCPNLKDGVVCMGDHAAFECPN